MITVFKPGSKVTIGGDIAATVKQVCLQSDGVTYEIVWWSERTRNTQWFADFEVNAPKDGKPELGKVGFVS